MDLIRSAKDWKLSFLIEFAESMMDRVMTDGQLLIEDNCMLHDLKTLTTRRFFNCVTKNLEKN